jgi:glycosyltransferase involved in cell wall biosynthesis
MTQTVLIHTDEIIGMSMAGPGMRAWRMAEALSPHHAVVLYTSATATVTSEAFRVLDPESGSIAEALEGVDIVVHQGGSVLLAAPELLEAGSEVVIVADLYGAWLFEQQEQRRTLGRPGDARQEAMALDILNSHLLRADHILCASERQRALWIGHLVALGRISHELYDADPALTDLITIVPFGLDGAIGEDVPRRVKGVVPGIAANDKVVLWGGGIHDWFDPLTLIRAMAVLVAKRPDARLLFLGTRHPNPNVPTMQMVTTARNLAASLEILGTAVIFNEGWVPLAERAGYFADSDVGVSIHRSSLETEFSFRTRMLDFLWAGLPIVATRGDVFADVISTRQLGVVVDDDDVSGVVEALDLLLYDETVRAETRLRVARAAEDFAWSRALTPFVELLGRAATAPDRLESIRTGRDSIRANEKAASDGEVAALMLQRDRAVMEADVLRRQLDEFRSSTSWRITAPLRKGIDALRRLR